MRRFAPLFALTALAAAGFASAHADDAAAGEPDRKQVRIFRMEHGAGGVHTLGDLEAVEGDRVKIDDLDGMLPGETRSYYTEGGKEVLVTRGDDADDYTLEVDGRTVELGKVGQSLDLVHLDDEALAGTRRIVVREHAAQGDEASDAEAIEKDVMVIAQHALALDAGEGGEAPVIIEIVGGAEGKQLRRVVVLQVKENEEGH